MLGEVLPQGDLPDDCFPIKNLHTMVAIIASNVMPIEGQESFFAKKKELSKEEFNRFVKYLARNNIGIETNTLEDLFAGFSSEFEKFKTSIDGNIKAITGGNKWADGIKTGKTNGYKLNVVNSSDSFKGRY